MKFTPEEVAGHVEAELRSGEHQWSGHKIDQKTLADVADAAMNSPTVGTKRG